MLILNLRLHRRFSQSLTQQFNVSLDLFQPFCSARYLRQPLRPAPLLDWSAPRAGKAPTRTSPAANMRAANLNSPSELITRNCTISLFTSTSQQRRSPSLPLSQLKSSLLNGSARKE